VIERLRREAVESFRKHFGREPSCLAIAPGRVNLIGEHTDYNGGHVLPMAVDRHVVVAAAPVAGRKCRFRAALESETVEFEMGSPAGWKLPRWALYVAGVGALVAREVPGTTPVDAVIHADLPPAAGMSSSAALEAATALAFLAAAGREGELGGLRLARLCQRAEHEYSGVRCGIMDQYSVVSAREGRAVYLNCHNLRAHHVELPPGLAVLVADSRVPRSLVDAEYNRRREDCESAAGKFSAELGRRVQLAEVTAEELAHWGERLLSADELRRARHVITEEERTARAVRQLERGDLGGFGRTARESHDSLSEDFQVSCPELDALVRLACGIEGVYGARLTGAGFGGSAVIFCADAAAGEVAGQVRDYYKVETGLDSMPERVRPAGGARAERLEG
jgi:galactokinase